MVTPVLAYALEICVLTGLMTKASDPSPVMEVVILNFCSFGLPVPRS